jgi:hypothetical protein
LVYSKLSFGSEFKWVRKRARREIVEEKRKFSDMGEQVAAKGGSKCDQPHHPFLSNCVML